MALQRIAAVLWLAASAAVSAISQTDCRGGYCTHDGACDFHPLMGGLDEIAAGNLIEFMVVSSVILSMAVSPWGCYGEAISELAATFP